MLGTAACSNVNPCDGNEIQGDDEASMATHRRLTPRGTALAPAQDEEGYYVHLG